MILIGSKEDRNITQGVYIGSLKGINMFKIDCCNLVSISGSLKRWLIYFV